jgi:hypothetical protein
MDAIFGLANNSVTLLMEKYKCKDRAYHFIYHILVFYEKYMVRNPIGNGDDIAVKRKEMIREHASLLQSSVKSPAHAKGTTKFLLNLFYWMTAFLHCFACMVMLCTIRMRRTRRLKVGLIYVYVILSSSPSVVCLCYLYTLCDKC